MREHFQNTSCAYEQNGKRNPRCSTVKFDHYYYYCIINIIHYTYCMNIMNIVKKSKHKLNIV